MIKSILQTIPSYVMSIFLLLTYLIKTIKRMMNSFWWGHGGANDNGIHWMSWEKFSMHKNYGGVGFEDLTAFNLAMLGKQGWKFQTELNSLDSRIFKACSFPLVVSYRPIWDTTQVTYEEASCGPRFFVDSGASWCIEPGTSIPILDEP